jgi:outer membrane receptor protein involved in Fe transport
MNFDSAATGPKPAALHALLAGLLLLGDSGLVMADQSSGARPQLEEIVVTARKREESLQRVPVAVSVIDGEVLRNNVSDDLTKIGELAPQVSLSQGGSGTGAVITIRGVSSAATDAGLDQSVAIEVDNMPISRGQIISASMFDMEQVQVLQGPQALFFGKNSPAGVISLKTSDPTRTFESYLTGGYEFEADERFLEGAVSGPITETLSARFALRGSEMDGWIDNVAEPVTDFLNPSVTTPGAAHGDTLPDEEILGARLSVLWEPTEDFDASFKWMRNSQERNAGNASSEPFCVGSTADPVIVGAVPIPNGDCERNQRTAHGAVAPEYTVNIPYSNGGMPYFDSEFDLVSLTLAKRFDALTLTSTTGYFDQTVKQMGVSDWSPFATIWAASRESYDLITEELRLSSELGGPVNFMVGLYYETFDRPFFNSADLFHSFDPDSESYASVMLDSDNEGDYTSVFGQINWDISERLALAVGARYSDDEKESSIQNLVNNPGFPGLLPVGDVLEADFSDTNVSPEATLSWFPSEDQTVYVAYKTGYKAGGVSNPFLPAANASPETVTFDPEEAEGFEVGYKAQLLDRRLRFDVVAYSYEYDDLQVSSYDSETITFRINNAASADIEGVQGSFEWLADESLTLRGNLGYNRAEYASYTDAPCYDGQTVATGCDSENQTQDLSGGDLARAPRVTYSLGADYSPALLAGWETTLSVNASYSDDFETATNNAPQGHQDSYWLVNAAVRVGRADGRYEVTLLGRNLTDEYYMLNSNGWSGSLNPEQWVGFFNQPREVGLQGTVRF